MSLPAPDSTPPVSANTSSTETTEDRSEVKDNERLAEFQSSPSPAGTEHKFWSKVWIWSAWVVYVGYLLLSDLPPGPSLLHTSLETLREAWALSLNFWLVLPAVFPSQAPILHPALEGLFNLVVTWGLLFWGFAVDGRQQRIPILPFLIGTAFLTNVFYLPWLGIRQPHRDRPLLPLNRLEAITENCAFPIALLIMILASCAWAAWGRSGFGDVGDRWADLVEIVQSDRLAYSFWIDLLVFWLFQGWLVPDDMARRQWQDPVALWSARLIPCLGLVIYFLRRPSIK